MQELRLRASRLDHPHSVRPTVVETDQQHLPLRPSQLRSSTGVVTFGGVLGTFVGNALGADNKKMAGVWLQVSLAVLMAVTVPVMM